MEAAKEAKARSIPALTEYEGHLERLDPYEFGGEEGARHLARYEWAAQFLPASRVLDCACGLGYGSALLFDRGAAEVVGVDVSPEATQVAAERYHRPGVRYEIADAHTLRAEAIGRFDRIVCLETFEHVAEPLRLIDVLTDLLAPDGQLLLSVPHDVELGVDNPYHLWHVDLDLLHHWLSRHFTHIDAYLETTLIGTGIWPASGFGQAVPTTQARPPVRVLDGIPWPRARGYLFACGRSTASVAPPTAAVLLNGDGHLRSLSKTCNELAHISTEQHALIEAQAAQIRRLENLVERRRRKWFWKR